MNNKSKVLLKFLPIILIIYLLKEFAFFMLIAIGSVAPGGYPPGVYRVQQFNKYQARYFFVHQKFGKAEDLFKEGLEIDLKDYKYSIEVQDNEVFHQGYDTVFNQDLLVKKHLPLLSKIFNWGNTPMYTTIGAVFNISNTEDNNRFGKIKDILCISRTPGWQQLNKPYMENGEPVCGEGTRFYING